MVVVSTPSNDGCSIEFKTNWSGGPSAPPQARIKSIDDSVTESSESGGLTFDTIMLERFQVPTHILITKECVFQEMVK